MKNFSRQTERKKAAPIVRLTPPHSCYTLNNAFSIMCVLLRPSSPNHGPVAAVLLHTGVVCHLLQSFYHSRFRVLSLIFLLSHRWLYSGYLLSFLCLCGLADIITSQLLTLVVLFSLSTLTPIVSSYLSYPSNLLTLIPIVSSDFYLSYFVWGFRPVSSLLTVQSYNRLVVPQCFSTDFCALCASFLT